MKFPEFPKFPDFPEFPELKDYLGAPESRFHRLEQDALQKISDDIERPLIVRILAEICIELKCK